MNRQWTIFLDIEETLIESWSDRTLLVKKIGAIKHFIKNQLLDSCRVVDRRTSTTLLLPEFGIMSWAVCNDVDKREFQETLQPWLEKQMRITFSQKLVLSMDDWSNLVMRNTGLRLSRQDIFDFCDKETVLFWLRNATDGFPEGDITLIDDAVTHNNTIQTNSRKITTLNVDKL